jgi:hypothetical protein
MEIPNIKGFPTERQKKAPLFSGAKLNKIF